MPELTMRALVMGVLLGILFGASSLYLVLKVGLTVSASIPVAVIAVTLFRLFHKTGGRDSTILRLAGEDGVSVDRLAEMFGLSRRTIFRVLRTGRGGRLGD